MSFLIELWKFLLIRRKYWLMPIVFALLILSIFVVFIEGSAVAPYIYAIF